jgi:hypothetical protein
MANPVSRREALAPGSAGFGSLGDGRRRRWIGADACRQRQQRRPEASRVAGRYASRALGQESDATILTLVPDARS